MTVSAAMLTELRRMVAEPTTTTYSDAILTAILEKYPIQDTDGYDPDDDDWTDTYDLHAAAADVWEEKAGTAASRHDFSADGGSYQRNQVYQACITQASRHRARATAKSVEVAKDPVETSDTYEELDDEELPTV